MDWEEEERRVGRWGVVEMGVVRYEDWDTHVI